MKGRVELAVGVQTVEGARPDPPQPVDPQRGAQPRVGGGIDDAQPVGLGRPSPRRRPPPSAARAGTGSSRSSTEAKKASAASAPPHRPGTPDHLRRLAASLELVEARLDSDDGWAETVAGCAGVLHVASPFPPAAPYAKSKTLAERAAWQLVQDLPEDRRFELVSVNPAWCSGRCSAPR